MSPNVICFVVFSAAWVLCGAFSYALAFAHFQREYPSLADDEYWEDFRTALIIGVGGVGGIVIMLAVTKFGIRHGLKWW